MFKIMMRKFSYQKCLIEILLQQMRFQQKLQNRQTRVLSNSNCLPKSRQYCLAERVKQSHCV